MTERILLLGGTGAYFLDKHAHFGETERVELDTPYGRAFPIFLLDEYHHGVQLAFASRHGERQLDVSPPFVNARANIWAAHHLGVKAIVGWNGVGAINRLLELHDLVVLDGVLDFTKTRIYSFQNTYTRPPYHHISQCFHTPLCRAIYNAARSLTNRVFAQGCYVCSEGPRLETAAEIRLFRRWRADVVGMTLVPEVFLAQELGISYGSLAYITNYATGVEPARGASRHFGVDVAERCLAIVREAAAFIAP